MNPSSLNLLLAFWFGYTHTSDLVCTRGQVDGCAGVPAWIDAGFLSRSIIIRSRESDWTRPEPVLQPCNFVQSSLAPVRAALYIKPWPRLDR